MSFNSFMHERNIYKDRPDFGKIALDYPEFREFAIPEKNGKFRVDFNDPNALRMLTKILLKKDFDLSVEIPNGYLIPTVPQRLNYILWVEDLLTALPKKSERVSGIDIGTGPCGILSLLGSKKNGWHFISTETADEAVQWAKKNIENNNLDSHIKVAKVNKDTVLEDVIAENVENFDFCVCNPPFFESKDDIRKKSARKREKLELFAKKAEIFSDGGEVTFVKQLLKDSLKLKDKISLYTSMLGKKKSFIEILKELQSIEGISYTKTEFCQGNTIRWGIAWTFLKDVNFEKIERPKPKKPKKVKPSLVHSISRELKDGTNLTFQEILENIKKTLFEFQIQAKILKSAGNYAEIEIISYQNTWSHQRRKKRKQLKGSAHEVNKINDARDEVLSHTCENKAVSSDVLSEKQSTDSSKDLPHSDTAFSHTDLVTKNEVNTCLHTCENKAVSSDVSSEKQSSDSSKNLSHSNTASSHTDLVAKNEVNTCLSYPMNEALGSIQKINSKDDHSNADFLDEQNKIKTADSSEMLKDSVSVKRKRDDEPAVNIHSKMLHEDKDCILEKSPDGDVLPEPKKLHISEEPSLSNKRKRKLQFDCSLKKKIDLTDSQSDEKQEDTNHEIEQTTQSYTTFETAPLLYSIIKLKVTKEDFLFEMNCPPKCNRETMHQIFQLFKNKFNQC